MATIAQRRGELGLSQEGLARRSRVSLRYVVALELGERTSPSIGIARRIAAALETTVDALWPPEPEGRTDSE